MILDFGCGDGGFEEITADRLHLGSWLASNNGHGHAYGIDINKQRIEMARQKLPHCNFMVSDGRRLVFADGSFDIVHCWGVLHHIEDWQNALAEIARVTKPGGMLLLTESVDNCLSFRVARRLWDSWHGDKISGYFTTHTLKAQIQRFFVICKEDFYYRTLISDVLRSYHKEPQASFIFNHFISRQLKRIGLDKTFCCHYSIVAVRLDSPHI